MTARCWLALLEARKQVSDWRVTLAERYVPEPPTAPPTTDRDGTKAYEQALQRNEHTLQQQLSAVDAAVTTAQRGLLRVLKFPGGWLQFDDVRDDARDDNTDVVTGASPSALAANKRAAAATAAAGAVESNSSTALVVAQQPQQQQQRSSSNSVTAIGAAEAQTAEEQQCAAAATQRLTEVAAARKKCLGEIALLAQHVLLSTAEWVRSNSSSSSSSTALHTEEKWLREARHLAAVIADEHSKLYECCSAEQLKQLLRGVHSSSRAELDCAMQLGGGVDDDEQAAA
jgi:Nuclear pore protein 84 / 107